MELGSIHQIKDVQDETGESRHLINFLIRDRQIPFKVVGTAKVLNDEGVRLLKDAIAEYRSKAEPVTAS